MAEVFLSHNSLDKDWVKELYDALQEQSVTDVFLDEYSIDPGVRLVPALEKGLDDALMFILVWSANAANSNWVPAERELALINHIEEGQTRRMLSVLLDKTPVPGFMKIFAPLKFKTESFPEGYELQELARRIARSLANARKELGR